MINKTDNGRWRVRIKSGGVVVHDRTFDLRKEAASWESHKKAALNAGDWVDPRRGKVQLSIAVDAWLETRDGSVSTKTYQNDRSSLLHHTPKALWNRPIASVRSGEIEAALLVMSKKGLAESSIRRYRAVFSSFMAWAVREGLVGVNPTTRAQLPRGVWTKPPRSVNPFTVEGLRDVYEKQAERQATQAEITLILGLTGLRWGELCAVEVGDLRLLPAPSLIISKSAPDGHAVRYKTKGGRTRSVPIPDEVLEMIKRRAFEKPSSALLFQSPSGQRLNGKNWARSVGWKETSRGRRIHDLRHTAATLWLSNLIDPKTAQIWLGHESMKLTIDLYSHFMGDAADLAGLKRLNEALGDARGTRKPQQEGPKPMSDSGEC